jgi:hypothetical protein
MQRFAHADFASRITARDWLRWSVWRARYGLKQRWSDDALRRKPARQADTPQGQVPNQEGSLQRSKE